MSNNWKIHQLEENLLQNRGIMPHSWENASYHGSASFECKYCNVKMSKEEIGRECPKTMDVFLRLKRSEELQELTEYKRIKYLLDKYDKKE